MTHRLYRSIAGCAQRFRSSLPRARAIQHARLRSILERNAASDYGRRYGFASIASPDAYRDRVPVVRYDDLLESIGRMERGEPNVLVAERLVAFEETGGSTAGPKLIPYTKALLDAFRRALLPWLDDLANAYPSISRGRAYWSISPAGRARRKTEGGSLIGLSSDAAYFGEALAPLVLETLAVPPEVGAFEDLARWREVTCRYLDACEDLALISVWSPTFLFELLDRAELAAKPWMETINLKIHQKTDFYMFCLSQVYDWRLFGDFNSGSPSSVADDDRIACLVIHDPRKLWRRFAVAASRFTNQQAGQFDHPMD